MSERRDPEERVSLHGLDPEEALRALLAVRPDDEAVQRNENVVPPREDASKTEQEPRE